jgi:hypothetical protein
MADERHARLLKLLGATVPLLQNRTGWTISGCPLAPWRHDAGVDKNPSFGIRQTPGDAAAHCFSCGFGGTATDLVFTIRHLNKIDPRLPSVPWAEIMAILEAMEDDLELNLDLPGIEEVLFGAKKADHVFPDWWLESFPAWSTSPAACNYLQFRAAPATIADALDLRVDTQEGRVCFPVRDFTGALRGLHGRAMSPDTQPRYRMYTQAKANNPLIWLGEHWVDRSRPIVVVEGPFDLLSVMRVYRNVVSPLFANPSVEKIHRMADALEQVTFFDVGKAGDLGRQRFEQTLGADHVVAHVKPPAGRKDPGECTVEELAFILKDLVQLDDFIID